MVKHRVTRKGISQGKKLPAHVCEKEFLTELQNQETFFRKKILIKETWLQNADFEGKTWEICWTLENWWKMSGEMQIWVYSLEFPFLCVFLSFFVYLSLACLTCLFFSSNTIKRNKSRLNKRPNPGLKSAFFLIFPMFSRFPKLLPSKSASCSKVSSYFICFFFFRVQSILLSLCFPVVFMCFFVFWFCLFSVVFLDFF